jgi:UDP-N-acetylglucosamine 2-epimerase
MKLLTVVGARPQFIKAAAVGYAIESANNVGAGIQSILIHTGQHYDVEMSQVFFEELGLQPPDRNLEVGSASHGAQTGRMTEAIEAVLLEERPDALVVYGDTNSTLAGALAAAKLHVPIAHVEAGLRSYNRRMPEEINRVVTDHLSRWLFCPSEIAASNLKKEGIERGVHIVGDVMYELVLRCGARGVLPAGWRDLGLEPSRFVLTTIHRAENTDVPANLDAIFTALGELARDMAVVVPLHPRTRKLLAEAHIRTPNQLHIVPPLPYGQMIAAEGAAAVIITDSGGVQKEAYWLGVPCVTVRNETEWLETLESGQNVLVETDRGRIIEVVRRQLARGRRDPAIVPRSTAASEIVHTLATEAVALPC